MESIPASMLRQALSRILALDRAEGSAQEVRDSSSRGAGAEGLGTSDAPSTRDEPMTPTSREDRLAGLAEALQAAGLAPAAVEPSIPERFGQYVVLRTLGRGGMGVVLEAFDKSLDRKVAVKLLHRHLAEKHTRRLVREAKALARLSHPNVVQVHEVGTVGEQTFVAMELVEGQTLQAWQSQRRGWQECVRVYEQAGRGLAAAHAKDLVHRDFKPGNCIIDAEGRVRVLDFGLVRELDAELELEISRSLIRPTVGDDELPEEVTRTGTVLGTLAYMPLEQLQGEPVDARADQFSFCVALYEALYGERPFGGSSIEALMLALRVGKVRPAPKGATVPEALRKVVVRGLAMKPGERWPSMEALRAELRRLVAPRRRRYWALGVTAGLTAMGVGLWQYAEVGFRCEGAKAQLKGVWDDELKKEVKVAILGTELVYAPGTWERVEQRLDDYTKAWAGKYTEVCEATRVTEEQTEETMDLRMGCLRERRMALHATVKVLAGADAEVVEEAVGLVAGLPMLDRCDDVELLEQRRQRVPPPEEPQVAQEAESLRERMADIEAERKAGKYSQALEQVEPLVQRVEALGYAPLLAEVKFWRGWLLSDGGKYAEAERELKAAYTLALEHEHDDVVLRSAQGLTFAVGVGQARHAEGIIWGQTALPLAERGGKDVELAMSLNSLGGVFRGQGKYEQAKLHHQRALRIREKALGADHPNVADSLNNLGNVFYEQGEYEQAKLHHQRALRIREKVLGADHPDVAVSLTNLGNVFCEQGEYEQAKLHHQRALQIDEKALGVDHLGMAMSLNNLGNVFCEQGEYEQAKLHLQRALQILEKTLGADHPDVAASLNNLGEVFCEQGEYEQAKLHYQRALQIDEKALGADHPDVAVSLNNLGNVFLEQGEYEQAKLHYQRVLQIFEKALGADHPNVVVSLNNLGNVFLEQGEYEQAKLHYQRALQIREKTLGTNHPDVAHSLVELAKVAMAQKQFDVVRAHTERALSIRQAGEVTPELLAVARFLLARALWNDLSQRARARELAEQARAVYAELGEPQREALAELEAWLREVDSEARKPPAH